MIQKQLKKKSISIFTVSMVVGGTENVIQTLLPMLVKDYDVTLFLIYNKFYYSIPKEVKVITLFPDNKNSISRRLLSIPIAFFKYKKYLKKNNIDVSISFLFRPNLISGITALFNSKTKFIISERNYPSIEYKRKSKIVYSITKFILKLFYNNADILFSNSEHINQDLRENFHLKLPMKVIYNPIRIPNFTHQPKNNSLSSIVSVGRFEKVKNHSLLFNIIEQRERMRLTILGDGSLRNEYIKTITSKGIENRVSLPGKTHNVLKTIANEDIFVMSSNSEGFPNALLEAMAVGLPVISTNCLSGPLELLNDNKEIIINKGCYYEGEYGILINTGDSAGLLKAIDYLSNDLNIRKQYSEKSRQRAKKYSLETIYGQIKDLIE